MTTNGGNERTLLGLLFVGFQLVGAIVLGYLLGRLFDQSQETAPWGILVGVILGSVAGFVGLIRAINRVLK